MPPLTGARAARLAIPMPRSMRTLPVDRRGYPVPFIAMQDAAGNPLFAINDDRKTRQCRTKHLCAICGKRRDEDWLVGGLRCFTESAGAFLDPPMHRDCAEYALRVCPYIAAPSYARRIDKAIAERATVPADMAIIAAPDSGPVRPDVFGLGMAEGVHVVSDGLHTYWRATSWRYVQRWRHGAPLDSGGPVSRLTAEAAP